MKRKTTLLALESISELNLTPMMDLTFILLITFILTFPLIEQGLPVNLPKADAADLQPEISRSITVNAAGVIHLDDLPVTLAELEEALASLGRAAPDTPILLRADETLAYGRIVEVMKLLHQAGLSRLALVTQAEGRAGAR